jgi:hypothetical protein
MNKWICRTSERDERSYSGAYHRAWRSCWHWWRRGDEGVMQWSPVTQCSSGCEVGGSFLSLVAHPPRIGLGLSVGRSGSIVNLVSRACRRHLSIYAVRRGPTNHIRLSAPDQGVRQSPIRSLGLIGGRSIPTTHCAKQIRREDRDRPLKQPWVCPKPCRAAIPNSDSHWSREHRPDDPLSRRR